MVACQALDTAIRARMAGTESSVCDRGERPALARDFQDHEREAVIEHEVEAVAVGHGQREQADDEQLHRSDRSKRGVASMTTRTRTSPTSRASSGSQGNGADKPRVADSCCRSSFPDDGWVPTTVAK